jgi:hypothetical protein
MTQRITCTVIGSAQTVGISTGLLQRASNSQVGGARKLLQTLPTLRLTC